MVASLGTAMVFADGGTPIGNSSTPPGLSSISYSFFDADASAAPPITAVTLTPQKNVIKLKVKQENGAAVPYEETQFSFTTPNVVKLSTFGEGVGPQLTAEGNGTTTMTFTDASGNTATLSVTVSGLPTLPTSGYAFVKQGTTTPITTLDCDFKGGDNESYRVSIYDYTKKEIINWNWRNIDIGDKAVLYWGSVKNPSGALVGVRMVPLQNGDHTTTFQYKDTDYNIDLTLTVNLTKVNIPDRRFTTLFTLTGDNKFGDELASIKSEVGVASSGVSQFAFVEILQQAGKEDVLKEFTVKDEDLEVRYEQTSGATVPDLRKVINYQKTVDGKHGFQCIASAVGIFKMTFRYPSVVPAENTVNGKCEKTLTFTVVPQTQHNEILVGPSAGNDFSSIQAAIDAPTTPESTNETITDLVLEAGATFTEDITVGKRVFLVGDKADPPTIKGTVTFAAKRNNGNRLAEAYLVDTIVQSPTPKTGTGISFTGYGQINKVIIKDFDIGIAATDASQLLEAALVSGCNTGITVNRSSERGGLTNFPMAFENNGTAIEIINMPAIYPVQVKGINFKNNDINVKNNTNHAIRFAYSSFIHTKDTGFVYDTNLKEKFTGSGKVEFSPYFKEEIRRGSSGTRYPALAYVDPTTFGGLGIQENQADQPISTANFKGAVKVNLETVKNNGELFAVAGWDFAATDNQKAATFNPAIATVLTAESEAAKNTIPAGTKYQQVSFAHNGNLPGVATVNLLKDSENPPAQNLKLYKVVNDKLVKQPEQVSLNNKGEFVFDRGDCSDYIITDTDISQSSDSNNNGSGGVNDFVDSTEVTNKLNNTPAGGTASFDVSTKSDVGMSVFAALQQNSTKTLVLRGDGYSWSIKGSDMLTPIP
ncbi:MAG: hypothetical protein RR022_06105, partial [Angelakisella sp.]